MHRLRKLGSAAALAAALALGCASSAAPPPNPTVATAQRLSGSWRLVSFRPERPLEAPLQSLLDAQLSSLTISFADSTYTASGPGITTSGRYEITVAVGDEFSGTIYDRVGAAYPVSGRFEGNRLQFASRSERWRGQGELERMGVP